jgi:hypothetical protein
MAKKKLNDLIDEKFEEEKKRRTYGKKPKTPAGQYVRPVLFGVILIATLWALFSQIYAIAQYFLGH